MSTLCLPNQYTELEQEEMSYLDGGWSGATFARNLEDLYSRQSFALRQAGFTWASVTAAARYGYYGACAVYGSEIVETGLLIGGIIGGLVAAAGAGFAIYYLGNHIVF